MTITLNGTTGVAGVDGTASTPAIQGNDTNTGIFFPAADTIAFAEGGAEVARFDSSGNLGIGTSSPSQKLEVSGSVRLDGRGNGFAYRTPDWRIYNTSSGNALAFDDYVTERMRITSDGKLLVGMTNTSSTTRGGYINEVGAYVSQQPAGAAATYYVNSSAGTTVGSVVINSSTTSFNTSSDYRLKENIAPMTGALDKVAQLKPCTYTWKSTGEESQGFIAHELQEVVPDCVTGEKDAVNEDGSIKAQGIDTSFLVATLTAAIQEQQAIITDLKARIETLENK